MKNSMRTLAAVLPAAMVCGGVSQAAEEGGAPPSALNTYTINPTRIDGRVVPGFYPDLEFDVVYDDNIFRSDGGETDAFIAILKPGLEWVGGFGKHAVRGVYRGEYGRHDGQSSENYNDHFFGGDITLDLSQKLNVNALASFERGHEARDTSGVVNTGPTPNRWQQVSGEAEVLYGRRIATAQIGAKFEASKRKFLNNGQSARNVDAVGLTLTGFYNLGPKTQVLVEPSYTEFHYPNSAQDNDVVRLLAGLTWEATAKTTGVFKIGMHQKEFDSPLFADSSGLSLDAEIIWEPKTYSVVTFRAARIINDADAVATGAGSFETTSAGIDWAHELTDLTNLQAGAGFASDDYNDISRTDDTVEGYIGLTHELRRWLTVGAEYRRGQRESSVVGNDYTFNQFSVSLRGNFD